MHLLHWVCTQLLTICLDIVSHKQLTWPTYTPHCCIHFSFCDLSIIILEPFMGVRSRRPVEHVGEMRLFPDPVCWPESGECNIRPLAAQLHSLQLTRGVVVASTGLPTVHHKASQAVLGADGPTLLIHWCLLFLVWVEDLITWEWYVTSCRNDFSTRGNLYLGN